mmetsp:Transcript_20133/g.56627  ORF Transcript_20133/g.56627 Transcript_20133/m.56627 type:complete len:228 (-) Transcript_20133:28-711(-)
MANAFELYARQIEEDGQLYQNVKEAAEPMFKATRCALSEFHLLHADFGNFAAVRAHVRDTMVPAVKACVDSLNDVVRTEDMYYRYRGVWNSALTDAVFALALVHWLENNTLLLLDDVSKAFGMGIEAGGGVHAAGEARRYVRISLEDFLFAVLHLPAELTRLSANVVVQHNYDLPVKIAHFIGELMRSFQQLSLKNDRIRRKFDGLKYELTKAEDILFHLRIRGLVK